MVIRMLTKLECGIKELRGTFTKRRYNKQADLKNTTGIKKP